MFSSSLFICSLPNIPSVIFLSFPMFSSSVLSLSFPCSLPLSHHVLPLFSPLLSHFPPHISLSFSLFSFPFSSFSPSLSPLLFPSLHFFSSCLSHFYLFFYFPLLSLYSLIFSPTLFPSPCLYYPSSLPIFPLCFFSLSLLLSLY